MLTYLNRCFSRVATAWILLLTLGAVLPAITQAAQTITFASAEPAQILIAQPTVVRFSADITDPTLITTSINLLRVGLPNTSPAIVGTLHDDGLNGDAIAGDGRYSIDVTLNEAAAKNVVYRISAAFKGRLLRVTSTDIVVNALTNRTPVALAGPKQAVSVGDAVTLDGRRSFDLDGDQISFAWALASIPSGSKASLNSTILVKPEFTADIAGTYVARLVVNDGKVNSVVSEITIQAYADNTPPKAVISGDLALPFGAGPTAVAALTAAGSVDPEGSPLSYAWRIVSKPLLSVIAGIQPLNDSNTILTVDKPGRYVEELIVNDGLLSSEPVQATVTFYAPNTPPNISAGTDQTGTVGSLVQLAGTATDADVGDGIATISWAFISRPSGSGAMLQSPTTLTPSFVADVSGDYLLEVVVTDSRGGLSRARMLVRISGSVDSDGDGVPDTLDLCPGTPPGARVDANGCMASQLPPIGISSFIVNPASGKVPLSVNFIIKASGGTGNFSYAWAFGDGQTSTLPNPTHIYSATGNYNVEVTIIDSLGTTITASTALVVSSAPSTDSSPTNPPPIDPTVATSTYAATSFLYSGTNPVQTGVAPNTIEPRRVAVLRGKVTTVDGAALGGVRISILNHPEFGQTLSRSDGVFDMAVNGGGLLTINYQKSGLITAQRQLNTPWEDYVRAPDVALIQLDSRVTTIDLSNTAAVQVARGSSITDVDGTRQATILFPAGTQATMTLANGSTINLTNFHVRATEFTVGPNGPQTMPANLPPTTGYTYEVEYSIDEAEAAGATHFSFSKPLVSYTENFLGFPVGAIVPYGEYDRKNGLWIARDNGRVIKILSTSQGLATLDLDGSGAAASVAALAELGIKAEELQQLALLYPSGQSLWRVPINHFLAIN